METPSEPARQVDSTSGQGTNRTFYLPRLPPEYYQGDAVVHWTLTVSHRTTGWLNETFHSHFREMMLHAAARQALLCPVYCLLPDHIHLLWMGLRIDSDQRKAMKFLREYLAPRLAPACFQHQPHDHVLREQQRKRRIFQKVVFTFWTMPAQQTSFLAPESGRSVGQSFPAIPEYIQPRNNFGPHSGNSTQP